VLRRLEGDSLVPLNESGQLFESFVEVR